MVDHALLADFYPLVFYCQQPMTQLQGVLQAFDSRLLFADDVLVLLHLSQSKEEAHGEYGEHEDGEEDDHGVEALGDEGREGKGR